jgi:hypothetical protein
METFHAEFWFLVQIYTKCRVKHSLAIEIKHMNLLVLNIGHVYKIYYNTTSIQGKIQRFYTFTQPYPAKEYYYGSAVTRVTGQQDLKERNILKVIKILFMYHISATCNLMNDGKNKMKCFLK